MLAYALLGAMFMSPPHPQEPAPPKPVIVPPTHIPACKEECK